MTTPEPQHAASKVEFVEDLPAEARNVSKWNEIRATLAGNPGQWAKVHAKGGYPRARLKELGCEVRVVQGQTYARWPNG